MGPIANMVKGVATDLASRWCVSQMDRHAPVWDTEGGIVCHAHWRLKPWPCREWNAAFDELVRLKEETDGW